MKDARRPPPPHERLDLRELVEGCCRPYAIPPDVIDDIVGEARARLDASAPLADLVSVIDEIVRAEAETCGRRCVAHLMPGGGVPRLLPRFVALSEIHTRPSQLRRALGSAAVALAKRAIDRDRFFLFFLAWIEGNTIAGILDHLGERPSDAAVLQRRLRRVSDTLERTLFARLDGIVAHRERVWLRATAGAPAGRRRPVLPPPDSGSWSILIAALASVIHSDNGHATPADGRLGRRFVNRR